MSAAAPRGGRMPGALWALLFGNFVIGSGVMVVPGTLNEISADLGVSAPAAGQLITGAASVMLVGAPLLAALASGWDRRRLLTLSMLWYALLLGVAAAMPSFGSLFLVRLLTMVSPALFTPQAAASVGLMVPPEQRGRAVTFVFLGWSVASVMGLPLATFVGGHLGWRAAFGLVAVLALVASAWVWRAMPDHVRPAALSREAWSRVFGSPVLMGIVTVTLLQGAGQFVLFSYFAPLLKSGVHADATQLSLFWAWFGLCGLAGNMLASRTIDRIGAPRMVLITTAGLGLSLLLWPLGHSLLALGAIAIPWGLACFSANSAQQARLVARANELAPGSIALNTSGIYTGQAIGTAVGGWLLANDAVGAMSWAGLSFVALAMALSVLIELRFPTRR